MTKDDFYFIKEVIEYKGMCAFIKGKYPSVCSKEACILFPNITPTVKNKLCSAPLILLRAERKLQKLTEEDLLEILL